MTSRPAERFRSWHQNLRFTFSHRGPDEYVYIGSAAEIPDEPLGALLPSRRAWAERHCRFVNPVVGFDPESPPKRARLRQRMGLPSEGPLFLATVGPHGDHRAKTAHLEGVFDRLRGRHPDAAFILVGPEPGAKQWISYHAYVEPLHEHFAASDFVFTQEAMAETAEAMLFRPMPRIRVDGGGEIADIVLRAASQRGTPGRSTRDGRVRSR